jgi:hypothetical protein
MSTCQATKLLNSYKKSLLDSVKNAPIEVVIELGVKVQGVAEIVHNSNRPLKSFILVRIRLALI